MKNSIDGGKPKEQPRKPRWLARIMLAQDAADTLASRELCDHQRRSLLTDFEALPRTDEDTPESKALYERAIALLTPETAPWPDVYQAYQYRAHLLPNAVLDTALEREVAIADSLSLETASVRERMMRTGENALTESEKRETLVGVVTDVQWERKKRLEARKLRALYAKRVCWLALLVGPFFLFALLWTIWEEHPDESTIDAVADSFRYPGLFVATWSGVLGAWFSMLVSIDTRLSGLKLDELRVAQRRISLAGRLLFGAASAVIFYFLLKSEILKASFLPQIDGIGFVEIHPPGQAEMSVRERALSEDFQASGDIWLPSTNLCLLIVWGVICGFSEKLIPAALTRHADAAGNTK